MALREGSFFHLLFFSEVSLEINAVCVERCACWLCCCVCARVFLVIVVHNHRREVCIPPCRWKRSIQTRPDPSPSGHAPNIGGSTRGRAWYWAGGCSLFVVGSHAFVSRMIASRGGAVAGISFSLSTPPTPFRSCLVRFRSWQQTCSSTTTHGACIRWEVCLIGQPTLTLLRESDRKGALFVRFKYY